MQKKTLRSLKPFGTNCFVLTQPKIVFFGHHQRCCLLEKKMYASDSHTFTHQQRLAAMQVTNQLIRSNWGLGVLLRDTSTRPGWNRTGNPPTAR